ncbi:MAG: hypothetical protein M3438_06305, partial [Pseudomonadota bacterium]|nr:hypothetical protein [Pseudomonadota bacterium]
PRPPAPSLAPRAAEAIDPRVPVAEPQLSTAVDPALAAQLSALVAQAEVGDRQFRAAAPAAQQAAASAGSRESESWIVAQQALSALVAARGPVTQALGDIDGIGAARIQRLGGIAAADRRAIEAAAGRVAEIDRREAALIDQLQARLR